MDSNNKWEEKPFKSGYYWVWSKILSDEPKIILIEEIGGELLINFFCSPNLLSIEEYINNIKKSGFNIYFKFIPFEG